MKRFFALFLALVMIVAFSACKSNQENIREKAKTETDTNTESVSEPVKIPEKTESEVEEKTEASEETEDVRDEKPIEVTEKEHEPEISPTPEAPVEIPTEEPTETPEIAPCLVCESTEHEIHPTEDYNQYRDLGEGRFFGRKGAGHFLLDENNKPIKELGNMTHIGEFHCGLARIYDGAMYHGVRFIRHTYGYIDRNGNFAIEFPYEYNGGAPEETPEGTYISRMYDFSDNMAYVNIDIDGVRHNVGINTLGNIFGCVTCNTEGTDWKTVHPESYAVTENPAFAE